jgi:flagellar protein FliL
MDAQEKGGRLKKVGLVGAILLGLAVGAIGGSIIVGPLLADDPLGDCEEHLEAYIAANYPQLETTPRSAGAPAAVYSIENLVLNPAQSGGTRFLMTTVGFGVNQAGLVDQMANREAEIRDIVLRVLGSKTVAELSDMNFRMTTLKDELRTEVGPLLPPRSIVDIYFPQFVLQ